MSNGVTVDPAIVKRRQHPKDFASQDDLLASVGHVLPLAHVSSCRGRTKTARAPRAVIQSDGLRLDKRSGPLRGSLTIERNMIG